MSRRVWALLGVLAGIVLFGLFVCLAVAIG